MEPLPQHTGSTTTGEGRRLCIGLINPRFAPSFWSYDYTIGLYPGPVRCHLVTGAPPALAGMLDPRHHVEILDENVEDLDFSTLGRFDVIGVTGMIVQRHRMREILQAIRGSGAQVVVGGPLVTCDEDFFEELCDVRFIGEAEQTWPRYIEDLAAGRPTLGRYIQDTRTDMSLVTKPRLDLLKTERYKVASVQFSRGCPYRCEFCDIIVMFGREPRVKRPEQVIAELEDVRRAGISTCFIVDDNFIGNKRKAKELLRAIIPWQQEHGYPLVLSTEASINLADDPELLELMAVANFTHVFIGIETPNTAALEKSLKSQNLQGDLVEKIRSIRRAGIIVVGGFIVGFDEDTPEIFDTQYRFIEESAIGLSSIGILAPLPTTPLYDRLKAEGRLYMQDPECAFFPRQMSREQLKQGHRELMTRVYAPDAFFERIFRSYREFRASPARSSRSTRSLSPQARLGAAAVAAVVTSRLWLAVLRSDHSGLIPAYWRAWRNNRRQHGPSIPFATFVNLCALHWHFFNIAHGQQHSVYLEARAPGA